MYWNMYFEIYLVVVAMGEGRGGGDWAMSLMEAFTSLFSHYWTVSPVCNAPPDSQCSCSSKEFKGAECEVKHFRSTAQAAFLLWLWMCSNWNLTMKSSEHMKGLRWATSWEVLLFESIWCRCLLEWVWVCCSCAWFLFYFLYRFSISSS